MMVVKSSASGKGRGNAEKMTDFFGPMMVDQFVRQAIQYCWMNLPKKRRNPKELAKQIQRLVDRAVKDFRKDLKAFGKDSKA